MIFSAYHKEDPDWMLTTVQVNGTWVLVGATAEEMFRKVLGEEEWKKRCAKAYEKAVGVKPPKTAVPKPPPPIGPPEGFLKRFINLKEKPWHSS